MSKTILDSIINNNNKTGNMELGRPKGQLDTTTELARKRNGRNDTKDEIKLSHN